MWIIVSILAVCVVLFLAWWILSHRTPRVSSAAATVIRKHWLQASAAADPHRRLLEADAIVAKLLRELGFTGSMADGLKKGGKYLPGLQDVWDAHKLRNRIAHEPGTQLQPREVDRALRAFQRVVDKFC